MRARVYPGSDGHCEPDRLLRQSVLGPRAGYEDVNDAGWLRRYLTLRRSVGDRATRDSAASASEMGRFEMEWLTRVENLTAPADVSGRWITDVQRGRAPRLIMLGMDSSGATHGYFDSGMRISIVLGMTRGGDTHAAKPRSQEWRLKKFGKT